LPAGVAFVSATASQGNCNQDNGIVSCSLGNLSKFAQATVTIKINPPSVGPLTNTASVVAASPIEVDPSNNTSSLVVMANNPGLIIVPAASVLLSESFPSTGGIEAGETVTVGFGLKNVGVADTTALVATLRNTGGVTNASPAQNYGVVTGGGQGIVRPFSFTAQGSNGGSITATLDLQDGGINLGFVNFTFTLGGVSTFSSGSAISIPDNGTGIPYPSSISVSNLAGVISKVTVTLSNLTHAYPADIDALLLGPNGQTALFMSDAGGGNGINNVTLSFDDDATNSLPKSTLILPGTYKPTNYGAGDFFPPPAPPDPYGSALGFFNGSNPNGTWSLFVVDDTLGDLGAIFGGWQLQITTVGRLNPPPARLNGALAFAPGAFQFTINGEVGDTFIIEAASDLAGTWTAVATNTLTGIAIDFKDSNAAGYGRRFYRARRP
jgi:subtilisin-like proprotein convertase family protein